MAPDAKEVMEKKKCIECGEEFERDLGAFCGNKCYHRYFGRQPRAHGLIGVEGGTGRYRHQLEFEQPHPYEDCKLTLSRMEDAGKLKDPDTLRMAKIKMKAVEHRGKDFKTDYQKVGHPMWD